MIAIVLALCAQDWEESFEKADAETRRRAESVQRISEEVSLLNLINGLYLTRRQSETIIALAKEAGELRDSTIKQCAELLKEFESALKELRTSVAGCGHIPPDVEQRTQEKEARVREAKQAYFEKLRGLEKKLCGVLTTAQLRVIDPFNPCLIPPQDLKDPVRVGQAATETHEIEEHLETIRNLPDRAWKPVAEALFDLFLGLEESVLGKFSAEKREGETARWMALAEKFRAMTDEEFVLERPTMALDVIRPILEHQENANKLIHFFLESSGGLRKAGKYLLNPCIVPLLEAKMKHACEAKPSDLDQIEAAESCRSCGKRVERKRTVERPGAEPQFSHVAQWLGLSDDQASKAREAIARGQAELLLLLAAERGDGRNILKEFLKLLLSKQEADAFALLGLDAPGTGMTYAQRIGQIQSDIMEGLTEAMTKEQMEKFRSGEFDLFKIKVGSLRWSK